MFYWLVIAWAITASSMQFGFTWEMAGGMMIFFFSPVAITLFFAAAIWFGGKAAWLGVRDFVLRISKTRRRDVVP